MPITLANVNRFSIFSAVEFGNKFATKYLLHCPPHLNCVAALPCEIKIVNFCYFASIINANAVIFGHENEAVLPTSYSINANAVIFGHENEAVLPTSYS